MAHFHPIGVGAGLTDGLEPGLVLVGLVVVGLVLAGLRLGLVPAGAGLAR